MKRKRENKNKNKSEKSIKQEYEISLKQ